MYTLDDRRNDRQLVARLNMFNGQRSDSCSDDRRGDYRCDVCRNSRLVYILQVTGRHDDHSDSHGDDRPVYPAYQ